MNWKSKKCTEYKQVMEEKKKKTSRTLRKYSKYDENIEVNYKKK